MFISSHFSDLPVDGSPFTLVNTEGEVIPGDQLGLVLYKRGGTLCLKEFTFETQISVAIIAATAICKEMGYKFPLQWIYDEDYKLDLNLTLSEYAPELYDVYCPTYNWIDCTSKKPNIVERHCYPLRYLMLSCTGRLLNYTSLFHGK